MPATPSDAIALTCPTCTGETGLPFERSFASREIPCNRCGTLLHWRHCAACEVGSLVAAADSPCPSCGAPDGATEPPEVAPLIPPDGAPRWRALVTVPCPSCGQSLVPILAQVGGGYVCPHCRRTLEDTASPLTWIGRPLLCLVAMSVAVSSLDALARTVVGPDAYAPWRTAWIAVVAAVAITGSLVYIGRGTKLRVYRSPRAPGGSKTGRKR